MAEQPLTLRWRTKIFGSSGLTFHFGRHFLYLCVCVCFWGHKEAGGGSEILHTFFSNFCSLKIPIYQTYSGSEKRNGERWKQVGIEKMEKDWKRTVWKIERSERWKKDGKKMEKRSGKGWSGKGWNGKEKWETDRNKWKTGMGKYGKMKREMGKHGNRGGHTIGCVNLMVSFQISGVYVYHQKSKTKWIWSIVISMVILKNI